ncbi:MAG: hypothetical protein LBL01_03270 [Bifidobacteriaceae bacterium]|jgi:predicted membrane protein|nr:hypothetical protein [Bifidobacteriaceae bacterium]
MAYNGSNTRTANSGGAVAALVIGTLLIAADSVAGSIFHFEVTLGLPWLHLWLIGLAALIMGAVWALAIILSKG